MWSSCPELVAQLKELNIHASDRLSEAQWESVAFLAKVNMPSEETRRAVMAALKAEPHA